MLREPAGEMDLENGFTDSTKMPNYTLYCAVSDLAPTPEDSRHTLLHAIAHPDVKKCIQKVAARTKSEKDKKNEISERQLTLLTP